MTKREAIRECKKLWEKIERSGLSKYVFLGTKAGKKWVGKSYHSDCPLCEFAFGDNRKGCYPNCPLIQQYDKSCLELGYDSNSARFFEAVKGLKEEAE